MCPDLLLPLVGTVLLETVAVDETKNEEGLSRCSRSTLLVVLRAGLLFTMEVVLCWSPRIPLPEVGLLDRPKRSLGEVEEDVPSPMPVRLELRNDEEPEACWST